MRTPPAGTGLDVPDRAVTHDQDDADFSGLGDLVGEAQPLPMAPTAKAAARRRRARLNASGGFGFQAAP